jgi:hypothetical protein
MAACTPGTEEVAGNNILTVAELRRMRAWLDQRALPLDLPLALITSRDNPEVVRLESELGRPLEDGEVINGYRVYLGRKSGELTSDAP